MFPNGSLKEELKSLWSFLAIPLGVVALFLIFAAVTYQLDSMVTEEWIHNSPALQFLSNLFGDDQSVRSLLNTIASAMITVTSITFSLLLVAVQQAAASFSNQILQQFRQRKTNQFYFGFFVGLSLYTLVILATTRELHHPLFGALFAILMTVVALLIILVLIFTTIEQMRGSSVIEEIARNIRAARENEEELLKATRRRPTEGLPVQYTHFARTAGDITGFDLERLRKALDDCAPEAEAVMCATDGVYVGRGDPLVEVRAREALAPEAVKALEEAIHDCIHIGEEPRLESNPQVGLGQLATIAWNNTSTAVSNPHPPILICRAVRELAWKWSDKAAIGDETSRIVYPDYSLRKALSLLEAMGVASAESKQPQTLAELYDAYAALSPKVEGIFREQIEQAVRLSLGALPHHLPTQHLNRSMERLAAALHEVGSAVAPLVTKVLEAEREAAAFRKDAISSGDG